MFCSRQTCYKLLAISCYKPVDNLGEAVQTQLVDGLFTDLIQVVRFWGQISPFPLTVPKCLWLGGPVYVIYLYFAVVTCSFLKRPANGYLTSNSQECGRVVQYHCDVGYQLIGQCSRRCQSDGTWSGNEPACQGKGDSRRENFQLTILLSFDCFVLHFQSFASCWKLLSVKLT